MQCKQISEQFPFCKQLPLLAGGLHGQTLDSDNIALGSLFCLQSSELSCLGFLALLPLYQMREQ